MKQVGTVFNAADDLVFRSQYSDLYAVNVVRFDVHFVGWTVTKVFTGKNVQSFEWIAEFDIIR